MAIKRTKEIFRLQNIGKVAPFDIEVIREPRIKVQGDEGVCFNRLFMKLDMTDKARLFVMKVCDFIDKETGVIALQANDTDGVSPMNDKQLSIVTKVSLEFATNVMEELCGYGMFAKVFVAETHFYVANPYFVTRGFSANAYLFSIFNSTTLRRIDNENQNFKMSNKILAKEFFKGVKNG